MMLCTKISKFLEEHPDISAHRSIIHDPCDEDVAETHFVVPYYLSSEKQETINDLVKKFGDGSVYKTNIVLFNMLLERLNPPLTPETCSSETRNFSSELTGIYKKLKINVGQIRITEIIGEKKHIETCTYDLHSIPLNIRKRYRKNTRTKNILIYYHHNIVPVPSVEYMDHVLINRLPYEGMDIRKFEEQGIVLLK